VRTSLVAAAALAVAAFAAACNSGSEKKTFRIGVGGPISGEQTKNGEDLVRGTELAVGEWNAKGGVLGTTIEVVVRDDEASPAKAKQVAQQLISEGVSVVVGHFNSGCTQPASEEYAKRGVVMITPSSTNPAITDPSRGISTVFRTCGRDDQQGQIGARFVAGELKAKKVFVLDDKTQYGAGLAKFFKQELESLGVATEHDAFTTSEKNFEPQIAKVKAAAPDVVFFGGIYSQFVPLLRQARERGVTVPFMGGDGVFYQKEVIEAAGGAAEGCFVTFPAQTTPEFTAKYKAKFGADANPGPYAIYSYDAAMILLGGVEKAGGADGAKVAAAIRSQPWTVASGTVEFDARGDLKVGYLVWEVKDNKFDLRWTPK
jgi:branched-chain amino acid transport system substrate-binding protein